VNAQEKYKVPHVEHLLAIIALAVVIHPIAGMAWGVVYLIHIAANIDLL